MSNMETQEIRTRFRRLGELLQDPQPGLCSWLEMLERELAELGYAPASKDINSWRVVQVNRKGIFADQIICIAIYEEWIQEFALMLNATYGSDEYKFEAYPPGKALWEPKRDRIAEDFNRAMKIVAGKNWVDKNPFNA